MAEPFAPPPINTLVSITPLTTPAPGRDALQVPPQLANLSPGTILEGFVVNRDTQSNPILRTPTLGDVMVKSDVFIKTGSEVVFRVDPTQQGAARIVSIDGMPPQDYAAALKARVMQVDTITQSTTSPQAAAPAQAAATGGAVARPAIPLQAVLVNTAPLPSAVVASNPVLANAIAASLPVPAGLQKLPQGTQLAIRVLQVALPRAAAPAPGAATAPPPAVQTAATPSTPASPPSAQPSLTAAEMANAATARLAQQVAPTPSAGAAVPPTPSFSPLLPPSPAMTSIQPSAPPPTAAIMPQPSALNTTAPMPTSTPPVAVPRAAASLPHVPAQPHAAPAAAASMPPAVPQPGIAAQVIGQEKDGATILQSPIGTLKIHMAQPLPVGSTVRLALDVLAPPGTPLPASSTAVETITALAQHWPALQDALTQADPVIARELAQAVPTLGSKLTSGLLFFIAAVKGGELKQWIGPRTAAALELKSPELAARLKGDMLQLQQMLTDSPLQQWNSVMVPMMHEGALEQARLFFRQDHGSDEPAKQRNAKGGKEQRFIVEVDLSHMGEVQFDGFVRPGEKAKQFDLIVRSHVALPAELTQKIRDTFDNAMGSTGMKGYLGFQSGQQHFVRPMAGTFTGPAASQPILA